MWMSGVRFSLEAPCPDGEIGRHAGFRYQFRKEWRFKSSSGHQIKKLVDNSVEYVILQPVFTVLEPTGSKRSVTEYLSLKGGKVDRRDSVHTLSGVADRSWPVEERYFRQC